MALALSEQRQVVCVGRSTRRPKRRLGREGAPIGQRGGAPLFVNLAGDEMALLIEMVVDLGMNAEPTIVAAALAAKSTAGRNWRIWAGHSC